MIYFRKSVDPMFTLEMTVYCIEFVATMFTFQTMRCIGTDHMLQLYLVQSTACYVYVIVSLFVYVYICVYVKTQP